MAATRKKTNVFYERYVIDAPRSHMAYALDVWKLGKMSKHFGGFNTVDDFLRHYASCDPRCHYEILRDETPMAVAFDLDVKYTKNSHAETIEAMGFAPSDPDGVLRIATEHIDRVFPQLVGARRLVSTSHRPQTQHSFHVKYLDFVLRDMTARRAFKAALTTHLQHLTPCIDASVYESNHQMRLLYSCKIDELDRPLLPVDGPAELCTEAVRNHMWSITSPDAVSLDIPEPLGGAKRGRHDASGAGDETLHKSQRRRDAAITYEPITWLQHSDVGPQLFELAGLGNCKPWCYKESLLVHSEAPCPFGCLHPHTNAWSVCLNDQGTVVLTKLFRVKQKHTPAWLPIALNESVIRALQDAWCAGSPPSAQLTRFGACFVAGASAERAPAVTWRVVSVGAEWPHGKCSALRDVACRDAARSAGFGAPDAVARRRGKGLRPL